MEIPQDNSVYKQQEYWNERFDAEEQYDWLVDYSKIQSIIRQEIKTTDRILIVGCGNSTLSKSMFDDGYSNIINIDYSSTVIAKMSIKHPEMRWIEMDMLDLKFDCNSFDIVLDKCAMDALLVDEEDPWNPQQSIQDEIALYLSGVSRCLGPMGKFLQASFGQPHFRRLFLDLPDYHWTVSHSTFGDGFGYFMYIMNKK